MSPALKVRRRKGNTGLWISRSAEFRKLPLKTRALLNFGRNTVSERRS